MPETTSGGIVTLGEMKDYLGIDGDDLDKLVKGFMGLAAETAEKILRFPIADFGDKIPQTVNEAIKFIVASHYTSREQTDAKQVELTASVMLSGFRTGAF